MNELALFAERLDKQCRKVIITSCRNNAQSVRKPFQSPTFTKEVRAVCTLHVRSAKGPWQKLGTRKTHSMPNKRLRSGASPTQTKSGSIGPKTEGSTTLKKLKENTTLILKHSGRFTMSRGGGALYATSSLRGVVERMPPTLTTVTKRAGFVGFFVENAIAGWDTLMMTLNY